MYLRDAVAEIPTELEALADETSATIATSLDGVLRKVAPCSEQETQRENEGERGRQREGERGYEMDIESEY